MFVHKLDVVPAPVTIVPPSSDRCWAHYLAISSWIAHAEGKANATLGFIGAASAGLVVILPDRNSMTLAMSIAVVGCAALLLLAAGFAAAAIWPRTKDDSTPANPLYYQDIATRFGSVDNTTQAVRSALERDSEYSKYVIAQIVANSKVASRKLSWVKWSVFSLILALASLAVAVVVRWGGW